MRKYFKNLYKALLDKLSSGQVHELFACPFCGKPPKIDTTTTSSCIIGCRNWKCGANAFVVKESKIEAINRWNKRAS